MIFQFLRRNPRRSLVEALFDRIATAARRPELYEDAGVPDTLEGRFESLALHTILVLRRLRQLPPPAPDIAQELVDQFFANLDASLREMGVGDVTVPKRMKKLGQAFYGRAAAYDAALDARDAAALGTALSRNVLGAAAPAEALAAYVLTCDEALSRQDLDTLFARGPDCPAPGAASRGEDHA